MTEMECLSLMELLDLRAGVDDAEARAHLEKCARCRALLAGLPGELTLPEVPTRTLAVSARTSVRVPERVRTGQLWRATAPGAPDWTWVVAVIGRAPDADDRLLVAPVVPAAELATDQDLLVDDQPLGYASFVDVPNLGTLLRHQLVECLGALSVEQVQSLVALYRWVLGAGDAPHGLATGAAVLDERDPRLLAAEQRAEELGVLWREVDAQVADDAEDADPGIVAQPPKTAPAPRETAAVGLGEVLDRRLGGPGTEWDRASLLDRTGVDGGRLDQFVAGRLDLTDKADVQELATVLHTLEIPWGEAQVAVVVSLASSPGGRGEASGPAIPMAARSRPGISEEKVTRDLYADQSAVDRSARARDAEIKSYLAELRRALDDLE